MVGWRRKSLVGLDMDASAVRMVQLRREGVESIVVRADISDIAASGGDPHLRKIHTIRAIRDGLARYDIRGRLAVCGLRGPEVVVRAFEFPPLPPEEIEGAVQLEVSQICPFLAEESTLDYQVTSNRDQKTRGFWVAATNGLIENTRQTVTEAALRCTLVDVAGLALLNLLRHEHPPPQADDREPAAEDAPFLQDAVILRPQLDYRKELEAEVASSKEQYALALAAAQEKNQDLLVAEIGGLRNRSADFVMRLEDAPDLAFKIGELANRAKLESFSMKPANKTGPETLPESTCLLERRVDLTFSTSFPRFAAFLNAPETIRPALPDVDIAWAIPDPYEPAGRDPMRPSETAAESSGPIVPPTQTAVGLLVAGILPREDRPAAIVYAQIVHEGQQIAGATVEKIDTDGVQFESKGRRWKQTVDK